MTRTVILVTVVALVLFGISRPIEHFGQAFRTVSGAFSSTGADVWSPVTSAT